MDWLRTLYAEQTSADEIVIFLLLGTVITLAIAFVIYAIVLVILSRWRMEKRYTVWQLLFPSAKRIRAHMAEYAMSTITALLLTLSVAVKHQHVDQVLQQDISSIGRDLISSVIAPNGADDIAQSADEQNSSEQRLATWLADKSASEAGVKVESLIRPLLDQGLKKQANLFVQATLKTLAQKSFIVTYSNTLEKILIVFSVTLLIAYATWFGMQRWSGLRKNGISDPSYSNILKKLALPAVCIPLLLLSAIALQNPERITDSVIARAHAVERQQQILASPDQPRLNNIVERLLVKFQNTDIDNRQALQDNLTRAQQTIAALDERIDQVPGKLSGLENRLEAKINTLEGSMRTLGSEHSDIRNSISNHIAEFNQSQTTIAALQGKLTSIDDNITSLNKELNSLESEQSKLQTTLSKYLNSEQNLERLIDQNSRLSKQAATAANNAAQSGKRLQSQHDQDMRDIKRRMDGFDKHSHNRVSDFRLRDIENLRQQSQRANDAKEKKRTALKQ